MISISFQQGEKFFQLSVFSSCPFSFGRTWIPLTLKRFVPILVQISPVALENEIFKKLTMSLLLFLYHIYFEKVEQIWRILYAKFGWNWTSVWRDWYVLALFFFTSISFLFRVPIFMHLALVAFTWSQQLVCSLYLIGSTAAATDSISLEQGVFSSVGQVLLHCLTSQMISQGRR